MKVMDEEGESAKANGKWGVPAPPPEGVAEDMDVEIIVGRT